MDWSTFRDLPTAEVARLVRQHGPKVCVFPINGTRRWFMLEYGSVRSDEYANTYINKLLEKILDICELFFSYGIDSLLMPVFGSELAERGSEYQVMAAMGLCRLATFPSLSEFCRNYKVRVHFYGSYRDFFANNADVNLSALKQLELETHCYDQHKLLFGICANDATETIASLSVNYYIEYGQVPDKRTLIELYYGEYIEPVDIFIGFDQFSAFDMPLIAIGREDLYFTVSPSPYIDDYILRTILYDHLFSRRQTPDYENVSLSEWIVIDQFYKLNRHCVLGTGVIGPGGLWYPRAQVRYPDNFSFDK